MGLYIYIHTSIRPEDILCANNKLICSSCSGLGKLPEKLRTIRTILYKGILEGAANIAMVKLAVMSSGIDQQNVNFI